MHTFEVLEDMLCEELEKIVEKGEITSSNLDHIDKLTHSLKSVKTIIAMGEEYPDDGYSYARRRDARGRYSRDEYSRRDRYSRKDDMYSRLENMAQDARSDKERDMIRNWMNQIEK